MQYLATLILTFTTLCQLCHSFTPSTAFDLQLYAPSSTTTKLYSVEEDGDFMASLRSRVNEVQENSTKLPLVILDSMLPRQILNIQVQNPLLKKLIGHRLEKETPTFGMLGMARMSTGQTVHLTHGVEVELVGMPEVLPEEEGVRLVLRGGRRFRIEGEVDNAPQGWTEGRVKFLDSDEEAEEEIRGKDRMGVARAIRKAQELTNPNRTMEDHQSLVETWIRLAKENERSPGQIDELLEGLGDIPDAEDPSERAMWIGALINPIPAMGVALEIRPSLLMAGTAEERIAIATEGIVKSIRHMDGSARLF